MNMETPLIGDPGKGVREFYKGRTVFVTGATGFLGQCVLVQLLQHCPDICRIHILVRPKQGKDPAKRLQEIVKSSAFTRLRKEQPNFPSKISMIPGQMTEAGCALSEADLRKVISDTSVVIHCAATISFTEPLKIAVNVNMVGLRNIMELAKKMAKCVAFVHVSTAYAFCYREHVGETLYPSRMKPQQLMDAMEWMTDKEVDRLEESVLGEYPNTYTLTKGMAEHLLLEEKGHLNCCIVRPSIISASYMYPEPGWLNGGGGVVGVHKWIGLGTIRAMHGYNDYVGDIIPVDFVANSAIGAGWKTAKDKPVKTPVYNVTTGQINPVKFRQVWGDVVTYAKKYPFKGAVYPPKQPFHSSKCVARVLEVVDGWLPAIMLHLACKLTFRPSKHYIRQSIIADRTKALEFFGTHQWEFGNNNLKQLQRELPGVEKELFACLSTDMQWSDYNKTWWLGAKKHLFFESSEQAAQGKRQAVWIRVRQIVIRGVLITVFIYPVAKRCRLVEPLVEKIGSAIYGVRGLVGGLLNGSVSPGSALQGVMSGLTS